MREPSRVAISVGLALDALREQCRRTDEAERVLAEERTVRDELIASALGHGISYRTVASITRLSRNRLWVIYSQSQSEAS